MPNPAPEEEKNPLSRTGLGLSEKQLGREGHRLFLVDNKLIMSKQCSPAPTHLLWEKKNQQTEEGNFSCLLSSGEITSGVVNPVLGSSVHDRHGCMSKSTERSQR